MHSQLNCFDSITYGKIKRPPTTHIAQLAQGQWTTPALHAVNRNANEKYHVVITGGQCKVYDGITGFPYPVFTPQGTSYLTLQNNNPLSVVETDAFSGTNGTFLSTHPGPNGFTWKVIPGTNSLLGGSYNDNFQLVGPSTPITPAATVGGYYLTQELSTPNYTVGLAIKNYGGTPAASATRVWGRLQFGGTYPSGYFVKVPQISTLDGSTVGIQLCRQDNNGTITVLATYFGLTSGTWPTGTSKTIEIAVGYQQVNNSIAFIVGGVAQLVVSDNTYRSPGFAAIDGYDASGGAYMTYQNFLLFYSQTPPAPISNSFRFVTVEDSTFIVNQTVTVKPKAGKFTPVRQPEALLTVSLADYGTNYYVTINGITVGLSTGQPAGPGSRAQLGTDVIAQQLYSALVNNATLNGAFNFTLLGQIGTTQGASTIYIVRKDSTDFTISANDGLSDSGLTVVKGTVQTIAQLPARALNGMVVTVQPDPDNKLATAYFVYNNFGSPNLGGVWEEAAAPGTLTNLDPNTMPWQLSRSGNLVAGYPADGNPPQPIIGPGSIAISIEAEPGHTATFRPTIADNGSTFNYTLANLTGAANQTLLFTYDVDMGNLPIGEYASVDIFDVHANVHYTQYYSGGSSILNFTQTIVTNSPANSVFTITLAYSRGATPPKNLQGQVAFHAKTDYTGYNTVIEQIPAGILISWQTNWIYAGGVGITVNIGGTPLTYTPTVDQTAAQVATGVAALAFSGYTGSVVNSTSTLFTKASGVPGACTVSFAWNNTVNYHNASLALVPGTLVGYTFNDLTDGSSGTVTANSATTITFGALSGGTTNTIRANDQVSVTNPNGQIFFTLQPVNWLPRAVGDDLTNPFPSLTFNPITEIGFTSGRLVLLSGENVICSASNNLFNLFRSTVTQLLDADRIDIGANSDTVSDWHSMVHWAEGVWLFAGNVQAQLPTEPALANSTVSIQPQTKYQSQPTLRPLAMDRRIFFARLRSPASGAPVTEILRYQRIRFPFFGFIAENATKAIPTYLAGTPLYLVGDPVLEIMILLTSAVPNQLYPYLYHYDEQQQLQYESWSTWQLDPNATILAIDFLDGVLAMIVQRSDAIYLEYMDMQLALYEAQS